jgi:hypothetical protein
MTRVGRDGSGSGNKSNKGNGVLFPWSGRLAPASVEIIIRIPLKISDKAQGAVVKKPPTRNGSGAMTGLAFLMADLCLSLFRLSIAGSQLNYDT